MEKFTRVKLKYLKRHTIRRWKNDTRNGRKDFWLCRSSGSYADWNGNYIAMGGKEMETVKEKLAKYKAIMNSVCESCTDTCDFDCAIDCLECELEKRGLFSQYATDTNVGDKWVSVDERLPEDGSSVFVMLTHTYESDYVTYGIARYIDTSNGERHWCEDHHGYLEWDKYSDGRGGCSSYKVTRWMPIPVIPQPPKGE